MISPALSTSWQFAGISGFQFVSVGPWTLNGFDIAVLVLLGISGLYAMARGVVRELISIAALFVAIVATLFVYGQFRFPAREIISPSWLADGILGLGTFALSYLISAMALSKINKTIAGEEPGFIDRILGAGFGVLRGLIFAALFVMVTTANYRASLEASDFRDYIRANPDQFSPELMDRMPRSMQDQLAAEPEELPAMYQGSTFYPVLEQIGDIIRSLPFAKARSYADLIQQGNFGEIIEDIQ